MSPIGGAIWAERPRSTAPGGEVALRKRLKRLKRPQTVADTLAEMKLHSSPRALATAVAVLVASVFAPPCGWRLRGQCRT